MTLKERTAAVLITAAISRITATLTRTAAETQITAVQMQTAATTAIQAETTVTTAQTAHTVRARHTAEITGMSIMELLDLPSCVYDSIKNAAMFASMKNNKSLTELEESIKKMDR